MVYARELMPLLQLLQRQRLLAVQGQPLPAELLTSLDDCLVEAAFRQAGFVLGFHVARQLMLGEIAAKELSQ